MPADTSIGKILRQIRERNGWTLEEMASKLGTTKQALSRYERGERSPKLHVAAHFSEVLGVSLEALAGQNEFLPEEIIPLETLKSHKVPLIGSAAAGEPIFDEEIDVYVDGPLKAEYAVKVKGDSMEPTFLDGDTLYIRSQPDIDYEGQIGVLVIGDDVCVKHIYHQENGLLLVSDNPKYAPKQMRFEDDDPPIRLIGIVIGFTRIYK